MCTLLVVERISYFLRNGSEVFATFMDMKKAFDMVKHSFVFKKLRDRNLPPIFMRLLIGMYISQTAKVKSPQPIVHKTKSMAFLKKPIYKSLRK